MKRKTLLEGMAGTMVFLLTPDLMNPAIQPDVRDITAAEEWQTFATDEQKDFAQWCIRFGESRPERRGHTLGALSWMESSLNFFKDHPEESYGPWGIGLSTGHYVRTLRKQPAISASEMIIALKNIESGADVAIYLYELHNQYFKDRGYARRASFQYAAQRYAGWKRWATREKYGQVFVERVNFLTTLAV